MNSVGIVIGRRGTGKTVFVKGDRALKAPGLIGLFPKKGMKVLIVDTIDHPSYRDIPILKQKEFKTWNSGVKRIFLEADGILSLVDLINRSPHMNNTFIVFEDAVKYLGKNIPKIFTRLLADSKQRNIDILFLYHCFMDTPGDIFTKSDYLYILKTHDSPKCRENKIGMYSAVYKAHVEVMRNPSQYFGKFVDIRTS